MDKFFLWGWVWDCETRARPAPLPSLCTIEHLHIPVANSMIDVCSDFDEIFKEKLDSDFKNNSLVLFDGSKVDMADFEGIDDENAWTDIEFEIEFVTSHLIYKRN